MQVERGDKVDSAAHLSRTGRSCHLEQFC